MSTITDAVMEALGLQIQALLAERKAVASVLGGGPDETVLDAAKRVAGDLASAEKQIDDVRDILKANVGELTVDAATHAIVLARNHATLVKQVEQLTRELDEARRRLKVEREHSEASDRHLVDTHEALGGRTGVEHVTEAAKRVVAERDAYRARVKDMESNVCKLSTERDEAKALATTLAKERDDARALCVAVSAELPALPDEPVLAAANRVAQDLRDEVGEARQARRDRDQALAELNAVRRILPPMNDRETTVDAAKRVTERCDEARADAVRMIKDLDDVRSVLEAKFNETTVDAARRVVADAHAVADAAREVESTAKIASELQEAISSLKLRVSKKETDAILTTLGLQEAFLVQKQRAFDEDMSAILTALGARADEKAIDVAKRVVKERDELRDAFQTQRDQERDELRDAFQTQRDQARKELEKVRLLLSPKGSWESTADATARVIKDRIEAIRDRDRALAALADTSSVVATRIREALGAKSDERTEDAAKRVVLECRGAEARVSDNVSKMVELVLQRDQALAERDKLRDELDKRMSL